jgi:hypothetical protein
MPPHLLYQIVAYGTARPFCGSPTDDGAEIADQLARSRIVALQDPCEESDVFGDVSVPIRHDPYRIGPASTT